MVFSVYDQLRVIAISQWSPQRGTPATGCRQASKIILALKGAKSLTYMNILIAKRFNVCQTVCHHSVMSNNRQIPV